MQSKFEHHIINVTVAIVWDNLKSKLGTNLFITVKQNRNDQGRHQEN